MPGRCVRKYHTGSKWMWQRGGGGGGGDSALERQEHVCDSHGHAPAVLNNCHNVVQDGPQECIKCGAAFQVHAGAHALDACKAATVASAEAHTLAITAVRRARCIHAALLAQCRVDCKRGVTVSGQLPHLRAGQDA